jgi:ABC-type sugar transport system substrate-binding protein
VIERVEAGDAVVLVGPDATEVGEAVRAALARGERVGAVVGSPDDPDVRAAFAEMLAELFGTAPTIC